MPDFAPLLDALRNLKAQGDDGFEGLIRDCLESLSGRTLRLQKSGPQGGCDIRSDPERDLPLLAVEAKRFGLKTPLPLDELKSKLAETLRSDTGVDIWGLVLSREMKEPDWSELRKIGAEHGVDLLCLDWREGAGTLPVLAAVSAAGRRHAEARLGKVVVSALEAIERHPEHDRIVERLKRQLNAPEAGFAAAAAAAAGWLQAAAASHAAARKRLRTHADLLAADARLVERPAIGAALTDWWTAGAEAPLAILGDEGRGKTWAALSWCLERIAKPDRPLVLAASSKDIRSEDGWAVIVDNLHRCMPVVERSALEARLSRWLQSAPSARVVLLIDGLNEKWSIDWAGLVRSFDVPPLAGKVALIMTCRSAFWRDDLLQLQAASRTPVREVAVSDFSDAELDDYLATHGLARKELPSGLLQLIRIPRFARLALSLRERLGNDEEITVARLVLEDWRARLALKGGELRVDDDSLLRFVASLGREVLSDPEFVISAREIHERLSADSGRDLEHYRAAVSELVEGLWLTRSDRAHQYKVNAKLLPFAIGLDLAQRVETLPDRRAVEDVIAQYEEQLRGADLGVAILRAAASVSFARGRATTAALEVLLERWIGSQNFAPADFEEMWPLAGRAPSVFLDVGERVFGTWGPSRGEGEILAKGLANAAKWQTVATLLAERMAKWAGAYGSDPVRWQYGERFPVHAERERRVQENEAAWLAVEGAFHRRLSAHFHVGWSIRLTEAALAIISYVERSPFVEALVTWAVTRAIMGYDIGHEQFEWVLRLNAEDPAPMREALLDEIAALRRLHSPVAEKAADILAAALSDPARDVRGLLLPGPPRATADMHGPWPGLDADGLIVWSGDRPAAEVPDVDWISRLARFAPDPDARIAEADVGRIDRIAKAVVDGRASADDLRFDADGISLVLSRWAPRALCDWRRGVLRATAGAVRPVRGHPADRLEEVLFVLGTEEKRHLLTHGLAGLGEQTSNATDGERTIQRRFRSMVVAGMVGAGATHQIDILDRLLPSFSFSRQLARLMSVPQPADLRTVFERLATATEAGDEESIASWLGYLRETAIAPLPSEASMLVQLSRHANKGIRGEAMSLLMMFRDEGLCRAFAESGWSHEKGQEQQEALLGTYLVCDFGTHLEFEDVRARVAPQALPYLVQQRGCRETELRSVTGYVHELLDEQIAGPARPRSAYMHRFRDREVWRKIVAIDDGVVIPKIREVLTRGRVLGMFGIFPLTEMVEAVLQVQPAAGAELWRLAKETHRRHSYQNGDFDRLVFAKSQDEALTRLRQEAFQNERTDADLADAVFWTLRNGHEAWLLKLVEGYLARPDPGPVARGIAIAGLLDCSSAADDLWARNVGTLTLPQWLDQTRTAALRTYRRNQHARNWLRKYFETADRDEAFGYLNLFNECQDTRSALWTRAVGEPYQNGDRRPWIDHFDVNMQARTERRKKADESLKKSLFFTAVRNDVWPWL